MSEAQQIARQADHELQITAEQHAKYRQECLDKAVVLAGKGMKDEAYTKLLMVVAIDGIREMVTRQKNTDHIEKGLAQAKGEKTET